MSPLDSDRGEAAPVPADAPREPDPPAARDAPAPLVESDLLVEEVSIDGMCGVY